MPLLFPVALRRRCRVASCAAVCLAVLAAEPAAAFDALVRPVLPSLGAQGRSGVAAAQGFETFFVNPAGFRSPDGEVTVLSLAPWLESGVALGRGLESMLIDQAQDGGVRFGGSIGIGYVGRGLGLGVLFTAGAQIEGEPDLAGEAGFQLALAGGYSYGWRVLGADVAFGACVRPLLQVDVPLDDEGAREVIHAAAVGGWPLFSALWLQEACYGVGVALDMGVLVEVGPWRVGAAATDVGDTIVSCSRARFGEVVKRVASLQGLPEGSSTDVTLTVPMQLCAGAAYAASEALLLHADIADLVSLGRGEADLVESLRVGLRLAIGGKGRLWLGMEGTALSAGAGWRSGPLHTSVAVYGLDLRPGSDTVMGIAAETAIRF